MEYSKSKITVDSCPHCVNAGSSYGGCFGCDGRKTKKECVSFTDHSFYRFDAEGNEYHSFYDFMRPPCIGGTYPLVEWKVRK